MKALLTELYKGQKLTREEAKNVMLQIGKGEFSEAEIASFLTVFNMRPILAEELTGFRDAMVELAVSIDLSGYQTIDVCGTGGDGKNTFNISTLTAFVLAGAGIKVVKHGNYGLSSPCGSSNIFEHFGYEFTNDESTLKKHLEENNLCYFHAPLFHPAMKYVAPVRKALKVRTFFNMLGPMLNPAKPTHQLVGVFSGDVQMLYGEVYDILGIKHVIVHSHDGYDEISLTGGLDVVSNGKVYQLDAKDFGFKNLQPEELHGGETIAEAAEIFENILNGNGTEAQNAVVIANAATAYNCMNSAINLQSAVEVVTKSLKSGAALEVLQNIKS